MSTTVENSTDNAWRTFVQGKWNKEIDVRDFIQKNYTPYQGDAALTGLASVALLRKKTWPPSWIGFAKNFRKINRATCWD